MTGDKGFITANPRGYQTLSEGNLADYGSMLDRIAGVGGSMSGAGGALVGHGMQRGNALWGSLMGAANRSPQYLVDQAGVDSQMATDNALGTSARNISRMGINPNSGRFAGLQTQIGLMGAADKAGAMTRARRLASDQQFGQLLSTAGLAGNQVGQGAGLMGSGGSLLGGAGRGYNELAEQYGSLGANSEQDQIGNAFIPRRRRPSLLN